MTRRCGNEKGIALLVTLLILVLIVALVHEVFRIGAQSAQSGAYGRDSIRCILLAEGGTGAARIALRVDARDNQYDTLDEVWSRAALPITLGDGEVRVTIEDEERKIDLNRLMLPNGNAPDDRRLAVFQRLLDILGIDRTVADAVVDWLDNDENPRIGGAESPYYLGLPNPYRAKNDLFDTIGELRLVRGVTGEVLEKLTPFVTVSSSGMVNLNTAPKEVLMSLSAGADLAEGGAIDTKTAEEIIEYRGDHPFTTASQIGNVSPFLRDLYARTLIRSIVDVRSTYFHVRSSGDVGGTVRTIDAIGIREGNEIQWRFWRIE
ncbi:type II secretion system minor pseudopilin GspK [Candidatus Deferrimicrobium sp.]|uniref:type II secretion system minor pseudopilin GspK n=1 Tax=Candidatus Deferrimicrobium sp. TaxID=3060586 RepID=UPI002ED85E5D